MNFVKKILLIIFLSLFYTGQVSSSKLPLDNLFWNIKDAKIIDELFIVASFEDGEETSFLIRSKASEDVFMITNKTGLIVEGSEYFFSKMNKKSILLNRIVINNFSINTKKIIIKSICYDFYILSIWTSVPELFPKNQPPFVIIMKLKI